MSFLIEKRIFFRDREYIKIFPYHYVGCHLMAAQVSLESLLQTFDIDIQLLSKNFNVYNYIHTTICYSKCHIFILNGFKWYRAMKMWLLKLVWVNISIDKQWLTTIG